jgi:protease IV
MSARRFVVLGLVALACLSRVALPLRAENEEKKPPLVAHIRLAGSLDEAPPAAESLFGGSSENFRAKLDRLRKAQKDPQVRAVYLQIEGLSIGWGKLEELTRAVAGLRKSGKKVFAYLDAADTKDYLLALACDEVCLAPPGEVSLIGLRAEVMFYKELFEKLGVQADMLTMGDYKSAAEPFMRSKMSEPARKQLETVLDDFFEKDLVERIVKSRPSKHFSAEQVRQLIDGGPYSARTALEAGLIDRVAYADELQDSFKTILALDKVEIKKNYEMAKSVDLDWSNPFSVIKALAGPTKGKSSSAPKVAVIYITGPIVTGKSGASLLGGESCGSTTIIEAIREAEADKTVKAIVLRVDSPGGSALASDLIWHELKKCKKPVVASMSDVAASGGYYVCMSAARIYAEPGTLTGSIGVLGGKVALGGGLAKLGVTTDSISRGANAGAFSLDRPFTDSERKAVTALMRDIYDQFLDKAVAGRLAAGKKFDKDHLEKDLAGGRIWTGRQALEHGLIDELGTQEDAIAAAWKLAKMPAEKEPELLQLPESKGFLDSLMDRSNDTSLNSMELQMLKQLPEMSRVLRPVEAILLLRKERVLLTLPYSLEIK